MIRRYMQRRNRQQGRNHSFGDQRHWQGNSEYSKQGSFEDRGMYGNQSYGPEEGSEYYPQHQYSGIDWRGQESQYDRGFESDNNQEAGRYGYDGNQNYGREQEDNENLGYSGRQERYSPRREGYEQQGFRGFRESNRNQGRGQQQYGRGYEGRQYEGQGREDRNRSYGWGQGRYGQNYGQGYGQGYGQDRFNRSEGRGFDREEGYTRGQGYQNENSAFGSARQKRKGGKNSKTSKRNQMKNRFRKAA